MEIKPKKCRYSEKQILEITDKYFREVVKGDNTYSVKSDKALIRLGQGATCFSTSLLFLAQDLSQEYNLVHEPITRKLIDDQMPLGWAEAEII
jgi:hypothetical protein